MASSSGVDGFIAGLAECGVSATVQHDVVTFPVMPVGGAHAGLEVEAGVGTDELGGWPAVPPHWIHLPETVRFASTNTGPSTIPSWVKHSRGTNNWGDAAHAAQGYLAHVRAVIGEAA